MRRRTLLGAALSAALSIPARTLLAADAAGARPPRVVSLDWGLTEMMLTLGVVPVGMANPDDFLRTFTVCRLPDSVVDVGLIFQPNMELLLALEPDLIVVTPAHARLRATLERIAPTCTLGRYAYTRTPYVSACAETRQMAQRFGRTAEAEAAIAHADAAIAQARARVAADHALAARPLLAVAFVDDAHLRIAGSTSLYGEVLTMLGLHDASRAPGAFATVSIESLGAWPDATLLSPQPVPAPVRRMMRDSPLWRSLPFAQPGRFVELPVVPPNGGVRTTAYLAGLIADALLGSAHPAREAT